MSPSGAGQTESALMVPYRKMFLAPSGPPSAPQPLTAPIDAQPPPAPVEFSGPSEAEGQSAMTRTHSLAHKAWMKLGSRPGFTPSLNQPELAEEEAECTAVLLFY